MGKPSVREAIRLRGVRHNNLKNFDLDLPLNQLIVITGLSGSGKSSLAFDTLFAEGQRRYIETFSPYARQFLDRMDKPRVDSIEGIPPAIAIEQRNAVRTTRSTVGTMTEVCDYMKVLWPHVAQLHCRQCERPVRKDSPQQIWDALRQDAGPDEWLITFDLPLTDKLSLTDSLALVSKQGYQRVLLDGKILRLDEFPQSLTRSTTAPGSLTIVQDRVKPSDANRPRFVEACEQAYHFGKGKLRVWKMAGSEPSGPGLPFSNRLHCATCDIEYREPSPALFSFNHPVGACPTCRGFGRVISIDYNLALPDHSRTLAQGVVKPWLTGHGLESQQDLMRACRELEIPTHVPFSKLAKKWQKFVIEGDPDYGKDEEHEWPRAWYGVKGYFRWLESKAYKMHIRVLLSRYRAYTRCPACQGKRFQPESLLYRASLPSGFSRFKSAGEAGENSMDYRPAGNAAESGLTLADFYQLPIRDASQLIESLKTSLSVPRNDPLSTVLGEVAARLGYLCEVGLGYLTLDRPTRSLSGGETERVNLTTCLGTRLVNTLFVLDEPSVGLHPRDTQRLVRILQRLRDTGNTVVVVEHEASVMRAANQIVDIGPGHGAEGGQIVFQGGYEEILSSTDSLTGQYLSGRQQVPIPERRWVRPITPEQRLS
ncbi:MAG TPA: excinuclease ABC subunit A, partial [Verrucomicrobiae bacterium]|nr:excinuclease ABC subunit A [Verrucomicrobiae bacterium]